MPHSAAARKLLWDWGHDTLVLMVSAAATQELEILQRAIDSSAAQWSPEMANAVLSIKLTSADVGRMNELAGKAAAGTLDAEEEMQLDSFRFSARLLEILKLRARVALKRADSSPPVRQ